MRRISFYIIVNMMKTRDMDPHYFHKPSLHFYLRMPSVAIGYYWAKKNGEIQNFQQIVSSDPFGIANYSFSSSHPRILKVARSFTVLLQIASIFLAYLIAVFLLQSRWFRKSSGQP